MPATPIKFLDRANKPKLALLHEIVHIEPLADEPSSVGHHETEVGPHELVNGTLGLAPASSECPARALIRPTRTQSPAHALKKRALEPFGR
jgi:hypothetical protein